VLAAALALTPILWHHYLVLLVVPIALAHRRLSVLWFVPAVGIVFEALGWYGGWAEGIAPRVSVLALIAAVTAGALWAMREEPAVAPRYAAADAPPVGARLSASSRSSSR
jgi:hypothetical protein